MGELLNRMGSFEIMEWVAELTVLRPADEAAAMKQAELDSKMGR